VATIDFNYDGKFVLTGSFDGTVKVWDVSTGALVCQLEGPEDIEWCEWHSKGNAIVAGSRDGTCWMWLTNNTVANPNATVGAGQCVQVFAGHDGAVTAGCFTSDGKLVCTGGEDGCVRVWAPKTGICKQVFEDHTGHASVVTCLVSHPTDSDLLLSGSMDGSMLLLQISTSRVLQRFVHSTAPLEAPPGRCVCMLWYSVRIVCMHTYMVGFRVVTTHPWTNNPVNTSPVALISHFAR